MFVCFYVGMSAQSLIRRHSDLSASFGWSLPMSEKKNTFIQWNLRMALSESVHYCSFCHPRFLRKIVGLEYHASYSMYTKVSWHHFDSMFWTTENKSCSRSSDITHVGTFLESHFMQCSPYSLQVFLGHHYVSRTGQQTMDNILRERRLRWLGHVFHMDHQRIPQQALYWQVPGYKRGPVSYTHLTLPTILRV